ncbi:hypothetical protein E1B28_000221 [Marasmius oreades]|uniref:Uncharacterized protein n=1 Tax=Marasmius oreades TaxID=181124 RepID=A0A9P7V0V3_9AGAR|nr:uncharacterized protein E1B28_000221 [Marasmius oreades]KAG7098259.1 hypothetical protein E1B28_000221 [Marasmius oreades]
MELPKMGFPHGYISHKPYTGTFERTSHCNVTLSFSCLYLAQPIQLPILPKRLYIHVNIVRTIPYRPERPGQSSLLAKLDTTRTITPGESHYIADINPKVNLGDLAPNYVLGFDHGAWRTVAQYYNISWTLVQIRTPTHNHRDSEFSFSPLSLDGWLDPNHQFGYGTRKIRLTLAGVHTQFDASAGVAIGMAPFPSQDNVTPSFKIVRNGVTVKSGSGAKAITNSCPYYNFNPTVGSI